MWFKIRNSTLDIEEGDIEAYNHTAKMATYSVCHRAREKHAIKKLEFRLNVNGN